MGGRFYILLSSGGLFVVEELTLILPDPTAVGNDSVYQSVVSLFLSALHRYLEEVDIVSI